MNKFFKGCFILLVICVFVCGLSACKKKPKPNESNKNNEDMVLVLGDGVDESDVKIQQEEAAGYRLATAEEIKELAAQGIFLHYDSIKKAFEL